jgi:acyl carrier protein
MAVKRLKMNLSEQEIEKKIIDVLCSSLALPPGQIDSDSRLITDLGMDSLDFLDIMFSLESAFNTKIKDREFDRVLRPDKSEAALRAEYLTDTEIERLSNILPALKEASLKEKIPRNAFFTFVTVDTLMKMVCLKLQTQ